MINDLVHSGQTSLSKVGEGVILKDRTNLADHAHLGQKLAKALYQAAQGNKTAELLHNALIGLVRSCPRLASTVFLFGRAQGCGTDGARPCWSSADADVDLGVV